MSLNDVLDKIEEEGILGNARVTALIDVLPIYYELVKRHGEEEGLRVTGRYIHKHREHYLTLMKYENKVQEEGTK